MPDNSQVQTILATDCGSTTTKGILIERQGGEYRLTARGEAPATVGVGEVWQRLKLTRTVLPVPQAH
jgi:activator of 2-hydroxyglutaryl-CoA dehydratase